MVAAAPPPRDGRTLRPRPCSVVQYHRFFSRSVGVYGTSPRRPVVAPGLSTFDLSVSKAFPIPFDKSHELLFRTEFFNTFNSPQFANPGGVLGTGPFGRVTGTRADNRQIQFALKYTF